MKSFHTFKSPVLLVMLTAGTCANAQPTLQSGDLSYMPGDYYTIHGSGSYQVPPMGAGMTWDFSWLLANSFILGTVNIVDPTGIDGATYFPTATAADHDPELTTAFYSSSSAEELYLGQFAPVNHVRVCNDPQTLMMYPFAYQNTFNDTYECMETGGPFERIRTGTTTVSYVGYGTVITPFGTYTDCALIRTEMEFTDEIFGDPEIATATHVNYRFHQPGIPIYLLSLEHHSYTQAGQTMVSELVYFPNLLSTRLEDRTSVHSGMLILPNPAVDMITVQRGQEGPCVIEIMDTQGRIVLSERTSNTQPMISLAGLPVGMYSLRMNSGDGSITQRVVKGL